MRKIIDNPPDQKHREAAEKRLERAAYKVLRARGVPEAEIPAEIERLWRVEAGFDMPSVDEIARLADAGDTK